MSLNKSEFGGESPSKHRVQTDIDSPPGTKGRLAPYTGFRAVWKFGKNRRKIHPSYRGNGATEIRPRSSEKKTKRNGKKSPIDENRTRVFFTISSAKNVYGRKYRFERTPAAKIPREIGKTKNVFENLSAVWTA